MHARDHISLPKEHDVHEQRRRRMSSAAAASSPRGRAPAPAEPRWLAAIPCAELERLTRLPAARLAAVFADALAARRRQLDEDPVLVVADARARQRVDAVDGSWPWAACGLVLRVLHEDDRLCAALTCRAFRDVRPRARARGAARPLPPERRRQRRAWRHRARAAYWHAPCSAFTS